MATKNYNLYLASADKNSGDKNNNANFNVNWDSFLPRDFDTFQVTFNFNASAGYYKDISNTTVYSHCRIVLDTQGRSFTYDTSNSGNSLTLGYANREPSNAITSTNGFNAFFSYNAPKTINRPTQNLINVKIYSVQGGTALVDTNLTGTLQTDMTPWVMTLSFIPIGKKPDNFPYVLNE